MAICTYCQEETGAGEQPCSVTRPGRDIEQVREACRQRRQVRPIGTTDDAPLAHGPALALMS